MGVEQAFNHLPNEYMKWAMQQRLDFLHVMINHEDEIIKLYQEMGERITKKLYSFGGYDFDRRTIEQMFSSLENERKRIEGLLTQCNVIRHMLQKVMKKERYFDTISFTTKQSIKKEYLSHETNYNRRNALSSKIM